MLMQLSNATFFKRKIWDKKCAANQIEIKLNHELCDWQDHAGLCCWCFSIQISVVPQGEYLI